jgi:hypothetical protein
MQKFELLADNTRLNRRSVADALEVLREHTGFTDHDHARVVVGSFPLPSGQITGIVLIQYDIDERSHLVSLPTAVRFKGLVSGRAEHVLFDIEMLDAATVSGEGHVTLTDGTEMRAVGVVPARLPLRPSVMDWRIVHHAIFLMDRGDECYRSLRSGLPLEAGEIIPDLKFLDCGTLSWLQPPALKVIASLIQEQWPAGNRPPSQQQIANSLQKFGIRVPTSRSRRQQEQDFATM